MTEQETFDRVYIHLLTQNEKSVACFDNDGEDDVEPSCAYRGDGGLRCAAGCLIDDCDYRYTMEGIAVSDEHVAPAITKHGHNIDLVTSLQEVHDGEYVEDWPTALADIAKQWKLTVPALPNS